MRRIFSGVIVAILCAVIAALFSTVTVSTQSPVSPSVQRLTAYWLGIYGNVNLADRLAQAPEAASFRLLATAQPDQCDYGLDAEGESTLSTWNRASFDARYPGDLTKADKKSCLAAGARLKTNQAYIWGLTEHKGVLWFGTIANTLCVVANVMSVPAHETSAWTCEGGVLDYRPPRIFTYDPTLKRLTDKTPEVLSKVGDDSDIRLLQTAGLRSAGSHRGVVFLGGIGPNGVNLFAFNAETGQYLGSATPVDQTGEAYTNIRQFIVVNDHLYVGLGVGISPFGGAGAFGAASGEILRWAGNVDDPFNFQHVAVLQADPAYLVEYQDRIAVSTWGEPGRMGGQLVYLSPSLGDDGILTQEDGEWNIIWSLSRYEVEPSALQMGGAIGVVNNYLVWGTMFIPASGVLVFEQMYPGAPDDQAAAFLGTYRPATIFRAANPGTEAQTVDLLYGNAQLPKFNPGAEDPRFNPNQNANEWYLVQNGLGQEPLMGPAGFGNFFNNYTWWMTAHQGKLVIGTMDYLYVAARVTDLVGVPCRAKSSNRRNASKVRISGPTRVTSNRLIR
jgi:hypothetical protein